MVPVVTMSNTIGRVPVNVMSRLFVMFGDVISRVFVLGSTFMFCKSSLQVSPSLAYVCGVTVGTSYFVNSSLSVLWFVFVFNVGQ